MAAAQRQKSHVLPQARGGGHRACARSGCGQRQRCAHGRYGCRAAATPGQVPSSVPAATASCPRKNRSETDVLKLSFDTEGGSLVRSEFTKHADFVDPKKPFVLLDQSSSRVYMAQTGLIGGDFPTHKTPMSSVASALSKTVKTS
jgi:YidC/Oxa1 family membrane protein insertase